MSNPLYDTLIGPHKGNVGVFLKTDAGASLSFEIFAARVAQIAHALVIAGLKPGGRVIAQTPKVPDAVALYAATIQAGGVYLPLNNAYTHDELAYFIRDAEPDVLVCESANELAVQGIAGGTRVLTLNADQTGSLVKVAHGKPANFATVARKEDDIAALLYTSGTTGRSKGAMLSHKNLLSNAEALVDLWQITRDDTLLHALPIFHTHGLFVALNTALLAGAQVRFLAKFDPEAIFAALPEATMMMGVPTFYTRLLDDPRLTKAATAHMRLFISGSAPLLAETHEAFSARTGHMILERYGMTEASMIASNPYDGARVPGTVGFAIGNTEIRVTNAETAFDVGTELPAGEIGMVEVRGDNVFSGYWKMPEKTHEELRTNGFFVTGDLGVMDAEGRLSIVGRHKDLIITGGLNVYPKEIEDVLNEAPGVLESAVYGVPDTDFGEAVEAAVVGLPGAKVSEGELAEFVAPKLARFKHPKRIVFVDELPRNTMGKVQKNILRTTAAAEVKAEQKVETGA